MSYFLKSGNTFRVATKESMDLHDALPAGNYVIKMDPLENFFLEHIEDFDVPSKVYGNVLRQTDRVINTFNNRGKSTGVLMTGEKGSGKTMLSKNICIEMAKQGVPTIVINQPWFGEKFNTLIQSIQQPAIVLFDEFEKVYDREQQEQMLTLLDGVYSTQKLFILTCNDRWRVDSHMRNRPGRIFYMLDFKGLDPNFIREFCQDNLKNKNHIDKIVNISSLFAEFNFDMLKALVEEMNRYNETPQEAMQYINAKPEYGDEGRYKIKLLVNGEELAETEYDEKEWHGNPLTRHIGISYKNYNPEPDADGDWDWNGIQFEPAHLKKIDDGGNKYVFAHPDGAQLVLTKVKEKTYNYWDAF